jgi:3-isopropylmalate/(R)-2-methylmalate dehydratase small subunit
MKAFRVVTGTVAPLNRADVDTDQIIPKQFLKRVERSGYGDFLFFDWRFQSDGSPNPDFVLNHDEYRNAVILVGGRNFGCGSSREHAAWALSDYGIQVIIAPSFADIFESNCFQNKILPVALPEGMIEGLIDRVSSDPGLEVTIDLEQCRLSDTTGFEATFDVDPFRRQCLLDGLDDIGLTLRHAEEIQAFEDARASAE